MAFAPQLRFDAVNEIQRIPNEAAQNGPHSWLCHGREFRHEEPTYVESFATVPASIGVDLGVSKSYVPGLDDSGRSPQLGASRLILRAG